MAEALFVIQDFPAPLSAINGAVNQQITNGTSPLVICFTTHQGFLGISTLSLTYIKAPKP
jgi:hypothetical protein